MKIDKAIERLSLIKPPAHDLKELEWIDAVQLGTEALKARKREKEAGYIDLDDLLPGETKD